MNDWSRTHTQSLTSSAHDVRKVMSSTTKEVFAICTALKQLAPDLDVDKLMCDVSIMVLNEVIIALCVQILVGEQIIREYRFSVAPEPIAEYGPPPDKPPIGVVPPGAHLRMAVMANPDMDPAFVETWLNRLGWTDVVSFNYADASSFNPYGAYTSGAFSIERKLYSAAQYDRPIAARPDRYYSKESSR